MEATQLLLLLFVYGISALHNCPLTLVGGQLGRGAVGAINAPNSVYVIYVCSVCVLIVMWVRYFAFYAPLHWVSKVCRSGDGGHRG